MDPRLEREQRGDNDVCPFCAAPAADEGMLGCCGAWVVSCEGRVDGRLPDELDDAELDWLWDRIVRHSWYADTGERAPDNYGGGPLCRCEVANR